MLGKKILAGVFAALVLIKLTFLLISPEQWLGATQPFLGHYAVVVGVYLVLLVITGYFIFTRLDLIDVAVVMLFTSVLMGLSLIPYLASIPKLTETIVSVGLAKAWPASLIWAAIAVAVLYRIFAGKRNSRKGGRRWRTSLCVGRAHQTIFGSIMWGGSRTRPYRFFSTLTGGWGGV